MATLLLVDDEDVNLYALKLVLESRGYNCVTATNGVDALRAAEEKNPDAILLDIQMPVMDGYEVCRRLKQNETTAAIPLLFLTARYRDHLEVAKGLDLGANDYVTKPFSPQELLARVGVMVRLRNAEEKTRKESQTDDLTGLHNRRFLQIRLDQELHRAVRASGMISCILLDIDHFKTINDGHGHAAGDFVLSGVAQIMRQHIRKSDLAVRYGGDEFLLILFDNDKQGAVRVAERIRSDVASRNFPFDGRRLPVTVSSGVSSYPEDGMSTSQELLDKADQALYDAKAAGRNVVRAS
jgi:diguanylate cyclase (GGDEF)-like protein